MLLFSSFLVPTLINVQVTSSHPNEQFKFSREQNFGGHFELAGFKNGAPYYCDHNKQYFIHYYKNKWWYMSSVNSFKQENGKYYLKILTSGLLSYFTWQHFITKSSLKKHALKTQWRMERRTWWFERRRWRLGCNRSTYEIVK